jgi:photosynthetic reaction center cytochrome c subunit
MIDTLIRLLLGVVILVGAAEASVFLVSIAFDSERPPVTSDQVGYRGTGQFQLYNPRMREALLAANQPPAAVPYAGDEGERAGAVYENVQVLGDVSVGEFTRLMVNITSWVAPNEGCAACHDLDDLAADRSYRKVVARRMLKMVRTINTEWTSHVRATGVTCYTCHRGRLVPPNIWFQNPGPKQAAGLAQSPTGQNHPTPAVGGSSLPLDPFAPFLEAASNLRIQGNAALAGDNRRSIKQAEWTYAMMMHFSQALGVNCNYCHNTRSFADWSQSPPQRVTAWHGIRMVRELNASHLQPLKDLLPAARLGPIFADPPKVNCATCHNGVFKPLFGVSMAQGFPALGSAAMRSASAK